MTPKAGSIETEDASLCICGSAKFLPAVRLKDWEYFTSEDEFSFVECENCRLLRLSPRPALSEFSKIYPPSYSPFQFDRGDSIGYRARRIRDRLMVRGYLKKVPAGARILDVGCGDGALIRSMRIFGDNSLELSACDINGDFVQALQGLDIKTYFGDFLEIEFPTKHYDLVFCSHTLEHIPDPVVFLTKMAGLVREGGRVIVQVPTPIGLNWFLHKGKSWSGYHVPRHFWLFKQSHLNDLARRIGFAVVRSRYIPAPGFWMQSFLIHLRQTKFPRFANHLDVNRQPTPLVALAGLIFFTIFDMMQILLFRSSDIIECDLEKEQH